MNTEKAHTVNGVNGRLFKVKNKGVRAAGCFDNQTWQSESRTIDGYGTNGKMTVKVTHDDQCKNGHNTFSVTAEVITTESKLSRDIAAGGCLHDDIIAVFPELSHLIKWHLCSTDGTLHYVANTVYHASDLDHHGKAKGEPTQFEGVILFDNVPIAHKVKPAFFKWLQGNKAATWGRPCYDFEVLRVDHDDQGKPGKYQFKPGYTFGGYDCKWSSCPFDSEAEARAFLNALQNNNPKFELIATDWSEGKERDFGAARSCAVWPEATDAELSVSREELTIKLTARLPELLKRFRADIEAIGFEFEASE